MFSLSERSHTYTVLFLLCIYMRFPVPRLLVESLDSVRAFLYTDERYAPDLNYPGTRRVHPSGSYTFDG